MKVQAIAICRVSTPEQRLSNSLNRQEQSVLSAAKELDVDVVRWWSGDISSKAGTNVNRRDLKEMLEFCKKNKRVKYMIVDEPDRFMRSIDEASYFEVSFRIINVQVWYASDPSLNGGDLVSKMLKFSKYFQAEGSNEERQRKSINGHVAAIKQGRYTFPPKPGYQKGVEPGVHQPHQPTFKPLQKALKDVSRGLSSPQDALKTLNSSSFKTHHAEWRMDKFRKFAIDPYYAGILKIDRQVKAHNQAGRHIAMISLEDHEQLVRIFTGTFKTRGEKRHYNPDFPMNKIMQCGDCEGEVKFTGSRKNNGYKRKTTNYYYKYYCRGCGKSYHRDEVHKAITKRLQEVVYDRTQEAGLVEAMTEVWKKKQAEQLGQVQALQKKHDDLDTVRSKLVRQMVVAEPEYQTDIKQELNAVKQQLGEIEVQIAELSNINEDLIKFLEFGLTYTDKLAEDWWDLNHEDRVRCQQLIFPGGITFNSSRKVGTNELSPIYSLQPNKKALDFASKTLLVELVGTAPTSAGLSWLVVYRHSTF